MRAFLARLLALLVLCGIPIVLYLEAQRRNDPGLTLVAFGIGIAAGALLVLLMVVHLLRSRHRNGNNDHPNNH